MKQVRYAFTLVEILIGISISMMLMVSVGVFITTGMKNITLQKTILDQGNETQVSLQNIKTIFSSENIVFLTGSSSGFLIENDGSMGRGFMHFIGMKSQTGYCMQDLDKETSHFVLSSFVPFEENTGLKLSIHPQYIGTWKTDILNHTIWRGESKYFGKGVFGTDMNSLNTPTGMTQTGNNILVSDTGNKRILFIDGIKKSTEFIPSGVFEKPLGLFLTGNTLYIADAGKKEVWKMSGDSQSEKTQIFTPKNTQSLTGVSFQFRSSDGNILSPSGVFSFDWGGTGSINGNILEYEIPSKDFSSGIPENFLLSGGNWTLTGTIVGEFTYGGEKYVFPYQIIGDNNILTKEGNTLTLFATGFVYPTSVFEKNGDIVVNDFGARQNKHYDVNGQFLSTETLAGFDFGNFPTDSSLTTESSFVVEPDTFVYTIQNDMLHLSFDYYTYYDCLDSQKSVKKTMIIKQKLQ